MNYNKLWKMLIDKSMNKKDLRLAAGVSTAVIAKLGKGDNLIDDNIDAQAIIYDDWINQTPFTATVQRQGVLVG